MPVTVSFRIVGLYCYAENVELPDNSPSDTVETIMEALKSKFTYEYFPGETPGGKEIVDTFEFTYPDPLPPPLKEPYNSKNPSPGHRSLSNVPAIEKTALIWQFYRSVTGTIDGKTVEIKLLQKGQPSFTEQLLNFNDPYFGEIPPSFDPHTYNLTWRIVQIELTPESQAKFIAVKAQALEKRMK